MTWEDFDSKQRKADEEAANRQAWFLVACLIGAAVLVLIAKACS